MVSTQRRRFRSDAAEGGLMKLFEADGSWIDGVRTRAGASEEHVSETLARYGVDPTPTLQIGCGGRWAHEAVRSRRLLDRRGANSCWRFRGARLRDTSQVWCRPNADASDRMRRKVGS